jgi:uncharacterized membrane protein
MLILISLKKWTRRGKVKKFFKNQITFLLFGLGFWLPITVLIFIIVFLFNNLEEIGRKILLVFVPEKFFYSGFGIVFGILIVYFSGIVLKSTRIKEVFSKIPVLGLFFGAGEIITIERLLHLNPCLFLFSPTCLSYGWILSEEKVKLGKENAIFTLINVYYPNVPSLITGQVFPVRKDTVIKLGNSSKEIIDLLLYAFRSPENLKYIPWEDESWEDLEKRAKSFGLNLNIE